MEATMILMCGASVGGALVGLLDPSDTQPSGGSFLAVCQKPNLQQSVLLTLEDARKKHYFGAEFDEDGRAIVSAVPV